MLPAITTMSRLLLLACFTVAASATGEGNSNQMLQPVVLPETTLADAGVTKRDVINMTLFEWMYNAEEDVTHLTICAKESLLLAGEVMKTNITLVYWMDVIDQTDIEGVVGVNQNCSLFRQDGPVYLSPSYTHYHLSLILSNRENKTIERSGSVCFGMPVQTSTLYCHEKPYTRVSGLKINQTIIQLDQNCITDDQSLEEDGGVCYLEGEFSSKNLCYTANESGLQVCLQGSSRATAEQDGRHSIGYLAYENVTDPAEAHLFLEFADGHKPKEHIEALISKQGVGFVTSCPNTSCIILNFTAGFAQYDVCAVTFDSGLPSETSTSSITDLNADAFKYDSSNLLQFDFTNANKEGFYTAHVETNTIETATVDCSAVPSDSTCHGYFEENSCEGLIVAVEYATATMDAKGNKILFTCQPFGSRRR